uniref:DUF2177 family protein n=1 Tax=viral metagenome TaxID=1070528 RepID=A0A6C0B833_9ZZZZ
MWNLKKLFVSTLLFIAIDAMYLYSSKKTFEDQIVKVQRVIMQMRIEGAVLCYLVLVFGINYFIIQPKNSVFDAFVLGVVIYAVYETTNYATLKKWSESMVVIDSLWGGILFALTTYLTYEIVR